MSNTVIALGGNALGNTPERQLSLIREIVKPIAGLVEKGENIVLVHGNGPQVGIIKTAFARAAQSGAIGSDMPFPECGAMSQGYIGFHLQNALVNEFNRRRISKSVATLITQVLVDENDPAFSSPTKPIGLCYSKEDAGRIAAEKGFTFSEYSGQGFRRVVPSPKPVDVIEKDSVRAMLQAGSVVIAAGGGGVPVVGRDGELCGVDAVIDKDFAAEKLAELIGADKLIILTAVDAVCTGFGTPFQRKLGRTSPSELRSLCADGQFAAGSMLPKVEACIQFAESGSAKCAVIASLDNAAEAIAEKSGTIVKLS